LIPKPDNFPTLPALTPDSRIWRIDWLGQVDYPGVVRQYSQPCIRVAISPWLGTADCSVFSGEFRTDLAEQRNVWVPLGALSMVRIGDLWQHGRLVNSPAYSQCCLDLDITPETTSFVKAGLAIDDHYLLPFSEHPWHRAHTQSYCLMVKTDVGENIIIPGAELVRFYFGTSSTLIKRLVTGPLKDAMLWQKKHHNPATGHLHLKLAPGLHSTSAYDVGRIALDSHARRAASLIYNHIVKATSQGEPAYLYTTFPLRGKTLVVASGIRLPAECPRSTYIVFRLRSCAFPFPFESLSIDCIERKVTKVGARSDSSKRDDRVSSAARSGGKIEPGDPGSRKSPRHFSLEHSLRFPDLERKPFWSEKAVATGQTGVLMRGANGTLETLTFGDPEGAGEARAITIGVGEPEGQAATGSDSQNLPRFVRIGMGMATEKRTDSTTQVVAKPLLPFGRIEPTFMLPMVVDPDGVVDTTLMHTGLDGEQRSKRACFVGLFNGDCEVQKVAIVEGRCHQSLPAVVGVDNTELVPLLERIFAATAERLMGRAIESHST
jgi:hypothetical protein